MKKPLEVYKKCIIVNFYSKISKYCTSYFIYLFYCFLCFKLTCTIDDIDILITINLLLLIYYFVYNNFFSAF